MKRMIVFVGSLALVMACSNPSASAGNNLASPGAKPVATPAAAPVAATTASAPAPADNAAAGTATAAAAPRLEAAQNSAPREVTLPAGTVLPVALETSVGSDISRL